MLAPFFVNLLMWCSLMLLLGWALDLVHGWHDSARHGASLSSPLSVGPTRRLNSHRPVCVGYDVSRDSLFRSGMTNGRKNA
jgi:hypothetical protein